MVSINNFIKIHLYGELVASREVHGLQDGWWLHLDGRQLHPDGPRRHPDSMAMTAAPRQSMATP
jgi:hypothetical protein